MNQSDRQGNCGNNVFVFSMTPIRMIPDSEYRLLADEACQMGIPIVGQTAWWLCRDTGIMSTIVKTRKTCGKTPGLPASDNLLRRTFTANKSKQLR